ncbi:DpnII family type II restriction endonuclease [Helicobacter cappadocius]
MTDGIGWQKSSRSLYETFKYNDYLLSLSMLEQGILEKII